MKKSLILLIGILSLKNAFAANPPEGNSQVVKADVVIQPFQVDDDDIEGKFEEEGKKYLKNLSYDFYEIWEELGGKSVEWFELLDIRLDEESKIAELPILSLPLKNYQNERSRMKPAMSFTGFYKYFPGCCNEGKWGDIAAQYAMSNNGILVKGKTAIDFRYGIQLKIELASSIGLKYTLVKPIDRGAGVGPTTTVKGIANYETTTSFSSSGEVFLYLGKEITKSYSGIGPVVTAKLTHLCPK